MMRSVPDMPPTPPLAGRAGVVLIVALAGLCLCLAAGCDALASALRQMETARRRALAGRRIVVFVAPVSADMPEDMMADTDESDES